MAGRRYRAIRKRDRKGTDVWGVAAFEPQAGKPWRQVAWKTVGRDAKGEIEARALAMEMERQEAEHGERFPSWHIAGERRTRNGFASTRGAGFASMRRAGARSNRWGSRRMPRCESVDPRGLPEGHLSLEICRRRRGTTSTRYWAATAPWAKTAPVSSSST